MAEQRREKQREREREREIERGREGEKESSIRRPMHVTMDTLVIPSEVYGC